MKIRLRSRRPQRCALLTALILPFLFTPSRGEAQANVTGQWQVISATSPINPIHVALLRTGKVLIVSGSENDPTHTTYRAAVWNPTTGAFSVQTIPWDLFCNAMTALPDGRVLITGGTKQYDPFRGIKTTTIFEPTGGTFLQVQDMDRGRWYPSNVLLADGKTMTYSGYLDTFSRPNNTVEIYDVATGWSPEFPASWSPPLYPWMHLLPNGRVFVSGSRPDSNVFDPATRTWTKNVARTNYGLDRRFGSSVLLPLRASDGYRPRVMIMGGNNPATATAEIIDLSAPTPGWRMLPPMSAPRIEMNAVLLPTGKVLALGGSVRDNDATTASRNADLFDPATETWSPAGTAAVARLYHSVALLMPDATVWTAGSNPFRGSWDNRIEIYAPPYLFTTDAANRVVAAPRPVLSNASLRVGYGNAFWISSPHALDIASVVLVRPGSNTHAFDFDQRVVELTFTARAGALTAWAPPNSNIAPPGYYMLFLVNRNGTPSVARFIQLTPTPKNQRPQGTILNPSANVTITAGQSVTFSGDGTDADGTVSRFSWVFPSASPPTSSAAVPDAVMFPTAGTYKISLTVVDDLGANDPTPATRTIFVQAAPFTASITNPPNGATVQGTTTVEMAVGAGGTGPYTYVLQVDEIEVFRTTTSSTTNSAVWDTTTVGDGAHTLMLSVTDAQSQRSPATRTLTVVNGDPAVKVSMSSPTPGQTVRGAVAVTALVNGPAGPYEFTLTAGEAIVATRLSSTPGASVSWDTRRTPNGPQTLMMTVETSAGIGSASMTVTVDNPPPP